MKLTPATHANTVAIRKRNKQTNEQIKAKKKTKKQTAA